jgi:hypothetical protein
VRGREGGRKGGRKGAKGENDPVSPPLLRVGLVCACVRLSGCGAYYGHRRARELEAWNRDAGQRTLVSGRLSARLHVTIIGHIRRSRAAAEATLWLVWWPREE